VSLTKKSGKQKPSSRRTHRYSHGFGRVGASGVAVEREASDGSLKAVRLDGSEVIAHYESGAEIRATLESIDRAQSVYEQC